MSFAHHSPRVHAPSLSAALGTMRARGMRVSTARRQILQVLYDGREPVSAEALAAAVPGTDLASVYRNLAVLEELGLVRHVHAGHGPGLYSVARESDREFITCDRCGAFQALDPARLEHVRDVIEREVGYVARFTHFPIVGICPACQAA